MIINREKKYIFVHIPRTSGTNLYNCLSGECYNDRSFGHIFARKIRHKFPKEFKECTVFSIVRNDFDRLHSWWYNKRHIRKHISTRVNVGFKSWLLRETRAHDIQDIHPHWDSPPRMVRNQRTSQLEWLMNKEGELLIDIIVRYDNLKEDLKKLGQIIGEDFSNMPLKGTGRNDSKNRDNYKDVYDQEMIDFVKYYHARSLKYFNFKF